MKKGKRGDKKKKKQEEKRELCKLCIGGRQRLLLLGSRKRGGCGSGARWVQPAAKTPPGCSGVKGAARGPWGQCVGQPRARTQHLAFAGHRVAFQWLCWVSCWVAVG